MIFTLVCAVPSQFDLKHHLSMREMANIPGPTDEEYHYYGDAIPFDLDYKMDVELLEALAGTIARSKVSVLTNRRPEMLRKICNIFKELGLVIHLRWDPNMAAVTTRMERRDPIGHDSTMYMLMAVNVLHINGNKELWEGVLKNVVELEDYYPPKDVMKQFV